MIEVEVLIDADGVLDPAKAFFVAGGEQLDLNKPADLW